MAKNEYLRRPGGAHLRFVDQLGGSASCVAVSGDLLALGAGTRLLLYDIADHANPRYLGASPPMSDEPDLDYAQRVCLGEGRAAVSTRFRVNVLDLTDPRRPALMAPDLVDAADAPMLFHHGFLFIGDDGAGDGDGLQVWNVAGEGKPRLVKRHRDLHCVKLVDDGTLLYAFGEGSFMVLDPSKPRTLPRVGQCSLFTPYCGATAAVDGRVYASADNGLIVIDCRDPSRPLQAGYFHTIEEPEALAAHGTRVYAALGSDGLYVIDAEDPARPHATAHIGDLGELTAVAATATHVYLASGDQYDGSGTGFHDQPLAPQPLRIVDVRDPARPAAVPAVTTFAYAKALAVDGANAYIIDRRRADAGLRVVSLVDPARPDGWCGLLEPGVAVRLLDTLAVVATRHGLRTFDCADPRAPRLLGKWDAGRFRVRDLAVTERRAYVLTEEHLHTISLARPEWPREIDLFHLKEPGHALEIVGDYAYIGAGHRLSRVRVRPGHSRLAETLWSDAPIRCLARHGQQLFAASKRGILVYDVHIPSQPKVIGWWEDSFPWRPSTLTGVGGGRLLYVREADMLLLDVSDIAKPKVIDQWSTIEKKWYVGNAAAVGNRCYVAARHDGILVLDVTPS